MFSYTTIIFASVASTALISGAITTVTDAARKCWTNVRIRHDLEMNDDAPIDRMLSAYILGSADRPSPPEPVQEAPRSPKESDSSSSRTRPASCTNKSTSMKTEVNRVDLKFQPRVLTRQGIKPSANACSGKEVGAGAPKMRDACSRRPTVGKLQRSIIPGPTKMANLAANIRGLQVARGRAVHPVPLVAPEPTEAPKPTRSADYVVPFPGSPSAPLRVSKSAPARMSRITQPSPARRIVPAKRFAHTQDGDEPVYPKRRRLFNPYPSLIQATSTPPRGSMSALIIPSPFADSPCSTLVVTSDSVMSLSELTCGRPPKYGRTTTLNSTGPVTGHESSSSGKPGALTRVPSLEPSLITQDTEMAAVDAVGMPEVTMSSVPPTPIWNEGRSSLDDDVEMEERCKDEDVVVWDAYRDGDEVMRDWTDEDVAMSGVT